MAVATIDRRTSTQPIRPRYVLILVAIAAGALLQHALVSLPLEPAPASPRMASHTLIASLALANPTGIVRPHTVRAATTRVPPAHNPARPQAAPPPAVVASRSSAPASVTASDAALTASIQRAFAAYALPYQESSALIVAVGRQFGVDPAIPAALFMHEDGNINNRAEFPAHFNWLLYHTHNPGNIKCMYQPCYGGFQVYPSYRDGILDWFRLYDHYYYDLGIHDLGRFVVTYCPPNVDGNGPPVLYQSDVMVKAGRIRAGWQGE